MKRVYLFLSVIVLWICINLVSLVVLYAQSPRLYFNQIDQGDGLSQTWNQYYLKDSRGFVWISSLNGLNRYDGQQIKLYKHNPDNTKSLPDNYIQSGFVEDSNADIWFTSYTALVRYDREHDEFERIIYSDNEQEEIQGYILAYQDSFNNIGVLVGGRKLFHYSTTTKEWNFVDSLPFYAHNVYPLFDEKGNLKKLYGHNRNESSLHVLNYSLNGDKKHSVHFDGIDGQPRLWIVDLLIDENQTVWVASSDALIKINDIWSDDFEVFTYNSSDNKKNLGFYQIQNLNKDQLLVSTLGDGLVIIDKDDPQSLEYPIYEGLSKEEIDKIIAKSRAVYIDNTGVIWLNVNLIGTEFAQIDKIKFGYDRLSDKWGDSKTMDGIVAMDAGTDGDLWYSNRDKGIFRIGADYKPKQHYSRQNPKAYMPNNGTHYLFVDDENRCWTFSYIHKLCRYSEESNSFEIISEKSYLYGIQLKDGSYLFSPLSGGLHFSESSSDDHFVSLDSVNQSFNYTRLFQNAKGLVFGARNLTNIDILDPDAEFSIIKSIEIKGDILSFCEDTSRNVLWIGTSNGLIELDESTWKTKTYTEDDGMIDHNIYAVLMDGSGVLWMSTNRGIVNYNPTIGIFHNFDIPDGIQGYEFNRNVHFIQSNGMFVFGGPNGINYFNPDSLNYTKTPPQVQFTDIEIEDGDVPMKPCVVSGATNVSEIQKMVLSHNENTLKFRFAAMEYSNPEKNSFQYKMSGIDKNWVEAGTKGVARYPNLAFGEYTFEVKAANSDGFWSNPKKMDITITPPFWKTWWFRLLSVLLMISIGYAIIRAYIRSRIRKQQYVFEKQELILKNELQLQQERNRIADELHDELGGKLSTIKFAGKKVQRATSIDEVKAITTRVGEISTELIDSMRSIIWAMDSHNDTLDSLLANIRTYASTMARDNEFKVSFDFPDEESETVVKGQLRHHLYLIIKELLNNFLKHSTGDEVHIKFSKIENKLHVEFNENGEGYKPMEKTGTGKGLKSIQKRIKLMNGGIDYMIDNGVTTVIEVAL